MNQPTGFRPFEFAISATMMPNASMNRKYSMSQLVPLACALQPTTTEVRPPSTRTFCPVVAVGVQRLHDAFIASQYGPYRQPRAPLKPTRVPHRGLRWGVLAVAVGNGSTTTFARPLFGGPQVDQKRDRLLGCQSIRSRYWCAPEQRRRASVSSAARRSRARGHVISPPGNDDGKVFQIALKISQK